MTPLAPDLAGYAQLLRIDVVPLDRAICSASGSMGRSHKVPFDRMIAAIALQLGYPPVSSDKAFDGIVARIW